MDELVRENKVNLAFFDKSTHWPPAQALICAGVVLASNGTLPEVLSALGAPAKFAGEPELIGRALLLAAEAASRAQSGEVAYLAQLTGIACLHAAFGATWFDQRGCPARC